MMYFHSETIAGFKIYEGDIYDYETCTGSFLVYRPDGEPLKEEPFNTYTAAIEAIEKEVD